MPARGALARPLARSLAQAWRGGRLGLAWAAAARRGVGIGTARRGVGVWGLGVGLGLGLDGGHLCWWWAGLQLTWANGLINFSGKSGISGTVAQNPNYPY